MSFNPLYILTQMEMLAMKTKCFRRLSQTMGGAGMMGVLRAVREHPDFRPRMGL